MIASPRAKRPDPQRSNSIPSLRAALASKVTTCALRCSARLTIR